MENDNDYILGILVLGYVILTGFIALTPNKWLNKKQP